MEDRTNRPREVSAHEASRRPVLCVGALVFDLMFYLDDLPGTAGKHLPTGFQASAAGMATSAATAIVRLGHPASLWARVGDDVSGDLLLEELVREGIRTGNVARVAGARSAISAILVDARGERIVVPYYDPRLMHAVEPVPSFDQHSAVLADVRWPDAAALALDGARASGIPAVLDLDVGPRPVLERLAPRATHVVASRDGAAILAGTADPQTAARKLSNDLAVPVLVTRGAEGVCVAETPGGPVVPVDGVPVAAVDTNAAGDVFHGAFVVALAEGMPLVAAARFANAAAAAKCTRVGGRAGAPRRAELDAFMASRGIRPGS